MQVKSKSGRMFAIPSAQEAAKIHKGAESDPDAGGPLSEDVLRRLRPVGRPRAAIHKERISIRLSPEVTAYSRSTGKGWQTRLDEALKEYVEAQQQGLNGCWIRPDQALVNIWETLIKSEFPFVSSASGAHPKTPAITPDRSGAWSITVRAGRLGIIRRFYDGNI